MIYVVSVSEAAYQAKNLLELKAADWQSATGVMAHIAMVSAWDHSRRKQVGFRWWEKKGFVESFCVWASLNIPAVVSFLLKDHQRYF